ncbi:MAG: arsenate reductase [Neisseria sp.]|nr:arsenate reductase [Neisseria sp.]
MVVLYGIANCDTVKKARVWLNGRGAAFEFYDFKKQPPSSEQIRTWLNDIPLDVLLNKRGTTWRKLSEAEQLQTASPEGAAEVMAAYPSVIKRPVLLKDGKAYCGFKPEQYEQIFG